MSAKPLRVTQQECGCALMSCSCGGGMHDHLEPLGLTERDLLCDEHRAAFDRGEPTPAVFKRRVKRRVKRRRRRA